MSAPKAKVRKSVNGTWMSWCELRDDGITYSSTQQEALTAGLAHLAAHHTAHMPMTPIVQTIVANTRCTCADLPRPNYPWFTPCPVHSWLINTTTAQMPAVAHGDNPMQRAHDGSRSDA